MSNLQRPHSGLGILESLEANLGNSRIMVPSTLFASVPADGNAGFAPGCICEVYTAAGGSGVELYVNQGTNLSCAFRPDEMNGAGNAALLANMGSFMAEGNLWCRAGNPLASNADGAASVDVIYGIQLPANIFDVAGRALNIIAYGQTLNNADANKQAQIVIGNTASITYGAAPTYTNGVITGGAGVTYTSGGTVLANTGASSANNKGWQLEANVIKYGAVNANTQTAQGTSIVDTTHGGVTSAQALTLTENATIDLFVTGAGTTAADIKLLGFKVNWMN